MKRPLIVLAVLLLLAAILAVLPYWFGLGVEATYQQIAQRLSNTALIQSIDTRVQRGWLGSEAVTRVRLRGIGILVTVEDRIAHGPLPVGQLLGGGLDMNPVLARIHSRIQVQNRDGVEVLPPFEADTVINMDGSGKTRVVAGPFKSRRRSGDILETEGLPAPCVFGRAWAGSSVPSACRT